MKSNNTSRLLAEQRRRKVLDLIEQKGQITVRDIVERFSVSSVTARGDLDVLGTTGTVVRTHGGAVRRLEANQDYPLRLKETLHHSEKVRIGRAAADRIQPNEVVILDSGTTTVEIARQLKTRGLQ
jgi:DeoR family transcriptional regulator of aga operon